ncbi:MAG TPA: amino acid deaminase/aldolase [Streptosporangiaceae bacterium]|nr:amino acid deaminase/aldolase [Streptosporangiaceae bacterium]
MSVDSERRLATRVARPPAEAARERYDRATADLDPPLALVDEAAFDRNAADMTRRAALRGSGGLPIRVATKSLRCRYLIERALATPGYRGVMCYTLAEALWLHAAGTSDDLLVAYPTVDRAALRTLAADEQARQHVTIMADSEAHLDVVDRALGAGHPEIRVCLELDVSWRPLARRPAVHIGTRRSPLHTPEQAVAFARAVDRRAAFRLAGVMGYEGQIAGLGDAPPGHPVRAQLIRLIQSRSMPELIRRRTEAIRLIQAMASLDFVNGGGTGSLESTAADTSVTELTAGSGLVGPTLFDAYRRFSPEPALLFALPVVRRPGPGLATLFSGGYVASGTGTPDRLPRPWLPAGLRLVGTEGAGEVQTPVRGAAADTLAAGDRVWMRHAKAGELAERFREYHVLGADGQLTTVPTYRGEGKCFG